MKPEAIARWKHTRSLGMMRYVLVTGVLSWGVPMFGIMTFLAHQADRTPKMIAVSAIIWMIGGAAFGALTWSVAEWQYRKATHGDGV